MIYGKISEHLNLKRISLKVWTLKDEILATLSACKSDDERTQVKNYYESLAVTDNQAVNEAIAMAQVPDDQTTAKQEEQETTKDAVEGSDSDPSEEHQAGSNAEITPINDSSKLLLELKDKRCSIQRIRPQTCYAMTYLTEVQSADILIFSTQYFSPGQTIVIEFCIPNSFNIQAEVVHVRNIAMKSRLISPNKIQYRVVAKFLYNQYGDRSLMRDFLNSLTPIDLPHSLAKKANLSIVTNDSDGEVAENSGSDSGSDSGGDEDVAPTLEDFEDKLT